MNAQALALLAKVAGNPLAEHEVLDEIRIQEAELRQQSLRRVTSENGSKLCGCGKVISANKHSCAGCAVNRRG